MSDKIFSYKNALTSAQKANLLTNILKGRSVREASELLEFSGKKASKFWIKLLKSGVGYFKDKDDDKIKISESYVGPAVTIRGVGPRGRGSADRISKRRSNLYVKLSAEEEVNK